MVYHSVLVEKTNQLSVTYNNSLFSFIFRKNDRLTLCIPLCPQSIINRHFPNRLSKRSVYKKPYVRQTIRKHNFRLYRIGVNTRFENIAK